jgi:mono/diheme cytochrome c family protein
MFTVGGMPQVLNLTLVPAEQQGPVFLGCEFANTLSDGPSTSVALDGDVTVFAQPEQARLRRMDALGSGVEFSPLEFGGESIADTGHSIFHRDTGNGIACASCHPEGTDDGRVWVFDDVGARRTQTLAVSIAETAPFHWDGSLPTLDSLMTEVFVERMGGVFESEARLKSLGDWMKSPKPQAFEVDDPEGVARGRALFESSEVGCATCHNGNVLTDNKAYDVGTALRGEKLQVPALAGLILHPPYMHNGCAKTLLERFEPSCGGGDAHGKTSHLSSAQINDLVTYMSSL